MFRLTRRGSYVHVIKEIRGENIAQEVQRKKDQEDLPVGPRHEVSHSYEGNLKYCITERLLRTDRIPSSVEGRPPADLVNQLELGTY